MLIVAITVNFAEVCVSPEKHTYEKTKLLTMVFYPRKLQF